MFGGPICGAFFGIGRRLQVLKRAFIVKQNSITLRDQLININSDQGSFRCDNQVIYWIEGSRRVETITIKKRKRGLKLVQQLNQFLNIREV